MKVAIVNGFSDQVDGGNPAGVVYLTEEQGRNLWSSHLERKMQEIATRLHLSETAFVKRTGDCSFAIRYFTPAAEVPVCGHATIASFSYLYKKGVIEDGCYQLQTAEAELEVQVSKGIIWMEMDQPQMGAVLDLELVQQICQAYEISLDDLDETLPVRIVSAGLKDIHVCVKNREILLGAVQHEEQVEAISKRLGVVGVHMSCLDQIGLDERSDNVVDSDVTPVPITVYCSNYAPLYDIPEECATGTSNCGLTFYLYEKGLVLPDRMLCFLQGEHMNRPSKVYTKVCTKDGRPRVWVGGCGVICKEAESH